MPITKRVGGGASGGVTKRISAAPAADNTPRVGENATADNTARVSGAKRASFNPWGTRWGISWGTGVWAPQSWLVREPHSALGATSRTSETATPNITKRVTGV